MRSTSGAAPSMTTAECCARSARNLPPQGSSAAPNIRAARAAPTGRRRAQDRPREGRRTPRALHASRRLEGNLRCIGASDYPILTAPTDRARLSLPGGCQSLLKQRLIFVRTLVAQHPPWTASTVGARACAGGVQRRPRRIHFLGGSTSTSKTRPQRLTDLVRARPGSHPSRERSTCVRHPRAGIVLPERLCRLGSEGRHERTAPSDHAIGRKSGCRSAQACCLQYAWPATNDRAESLCLLAIGWKCDEPSCPQKRSRLTSAQRRPDRAPQRLGALAGADGVGRLRRDVRIGSAGGVSDVGGRPEPHRETHVHGNETSRFVMSAPAWCVTRAVSKASETRSRECRTHDPRADV